MARETAASMGLCLCLATGSVAIGCLAAWPGRAAGSEQLAAEHTVRGRAVAGQEAGDGGAGRVFARLDRNRDGVIDFAEMRRARDGWVTQVDTNGDGRISRSEFLLAPPRGPDGRVAPVLRARRARVFARIDMNGDGQIDAAEREASLRRWFARRDLDSDGRLSYEELTAARKRWLAWRGRGAEERVAPRGRALRRRGLGRFDRNADGAVSYDELSAARAGRMEAIDRNRDGRVSYDEFVNAPTGRAGRPAHRRWRARLFLRIDRNHDGYITPDEHAAALRGWFARIDRDGNGLISEAEMAAARARWRARRRAE